MEIDDNEELIHREPGFVIKKSEKGCTLFVEEINGERHRVADFKSKYCALSYIHEELRET